MNPNKAKIYRSYTVEEIANLFCVHKNTVRAWLKAGLPICDDRKPTVENCKITVN
jgi:transposase